MSNTVDNKFSERSRKNLQEILQGLASVGQVTVSRHLNISESTVSKMKDSDHPDVRMTFKTMADAFAVMGLQIIPADQKTIDPETLKMLLHTLDLWRKSIKSVDDLTGE